MGREDVLDELRRKIADMGPAGPTAGESEPARDVTRSEKAVASASVEPGSDDEKSRAFKKIVDLVNTSDRSERAVRERLARAGFSDRAIDDAVQRALKYGFIDDLRFADVLIRSRIAQGKGSAGIARELASNGIDAQDVPGWPYDFDIGEDAEIDRALSFLDRKPPRSKNARDGAFRKLVQRGFGTTTASTAARIWSERNG